ncbi:MAG: thioredoxin family protein [Oscillospiraceae bacterium]|nr:thioredoxin family protein [Oscillospiraceae bacterium]
MKDILMFYLDDCGYCHKAHKALEELMSESPEYRNLTIRKVEESKQPCLADSYDYYAVPTFYVGNRKVFEAHIGMSYDDIKAAVRSALDAALDA